MAEFNNYLEDIIQTSNLVNAEHSSTSEASNNSNALKETVVSGEERADAVTDKTDNAAISTSEVGKIKKKKKNSDAVKRCRQKRRVMEKQKEALLIKFKEENEGLSEQITGLENEIRYLQGLLAGAETFRQQSFEAAQIQTPIYGQQNMLPMMMKQLPTNIKQADTEVLSSSPHLSWTPTFCKY